MVLVAKRTVLRLYELLEQVYTVGFFNLCASGLTCLVTTCGNCGKVHILLYLICHVAESIDILGMLTLKGPKG